MQCSGTLVYEERGKKKMLIFSCLYYVTGRSRNGVIHKRKGKIETNIRLTQMKIDFNQ